MFTRLIRTFHTTLPQLIREKRRVNPGLSYQLNEFTEEGKEDNHDVVNDLADMEADFSHLNQTYREWKHEEEQQRDRIRRMIIKRKYFREPHLPNLLTYAEKEQIRLLHAREPEEWPIARLAESFPANEQIINKIVRAKWRPNSIQRIKAHDEAVIKNWQRFRNEPLFADKFPPALKSHLIKFANRKIANTLLTAKAFPVRLELPRPKSNEFQSIITSCSKYKEEQKLTTLQLPLIGSEKVENTNIQPSAKNLEDETYLLQDIQDKRYMRLKELKELKLKKKSEEIESKIIENPAGTGIISNNATDIMQQFEEQDIEITKMDADRFGMATYKNRVYIPRKIWRKGATYRIEDCYYDDDGEFLYRVPGMTRKQ